MKLFFTTLFLLFIFMAESQSQILNPGFEFWTDDDPDDWLTFDIFGFANTVTQSSDAHSGSSAARLEVVDIGGGTAYPPFLYSGENGEGFSVSQRHGSLIGYYKFNPLGPNDHFWVAVSMIKNGNAVGGGFFFTDAAASSYTQFVAPITYFEPNTPDTVYIIIAIIDTSGSQSSIGAYALVDDLSFSGPSDVKQEDLTPSTFNLLQNYPNPFNPSTKITFSVTEQSYVELIIYDMLGREIEKLINDDFYPGVYTVDFSADNLPGGVYIAKMSAGNFTKAIKMTLLK